MQIATTRADDFEDRGEPVRRCWSLTGAPVSTRLGVPGEDLDGVISGWSSSRRPSAAHAARLAGKRAVIVGGWNVAMDAARIARRLADGEQGQGGRRSWYGRRAGRRRLGAPEVTAAYRRGRGEMPTAGGGRAGGDRVQAQGRFLFEPLGDEQGRVRGLRCVRTELGAPMFGRRLQPVPGSEFVTDCEVVIAAAGLQPEAAFASRWRRPPTGRSRPTWNAGKHPVPMPFAARRCRVGRAGHRARGRARQRAAFNDDRWLQGAELIERASTPSCRSTEAADVLAKPHPARGRLDQRTPGDPLRRRPGRFRGTNRRPRRRPGTPPDCAWTAASTTHHSGPRAQRPLQCRERIAAATGWRAADGCVHHGRG